MDRGLLVDMCAFLIRFLPFDVFTTLFLSMLLFGDNSQLCYRFRIYIRIQVSSTGLKGLFPILQRLLSITNYRHRIQPNFLNFSRENFITNIPFRNQMLVLKGKKQFLQIVPNQLLLIETENYFFLLETIHYRLKLFKNSNGFFQYF